MKKSSSLLTASKTTPVPASPAGVIHCGVLVEGRWAVAAIGNAVATALLLFAVVGCKSTTAVYNSKTGEWRVNDARLFLRTEAEIHARIDTNGTRTVTINAKSDPASEAIKAAAQGAAAGAVSAFKP